MKLRTVALFALTALSCKSEAEKRKEGLEGFCARVEAMVSSGELSSFNPADQATIVVSKVVEKTPALEGFFAEVAKAPAETRLQNMRELATRQTGKPWSCPAFEAVWNQKDPAPAPPQTRELFDPAPTAPPATP